MRRSRFVVLGLGLILVAGYPPNLLDAQVPLGSVSRRGQTVTPAYEGWYWNQDGTKSVSFGYFNRNYDEIIEIPIGPNNFMTPVDSHPGQPTLFAPRRHWGVFTVVVPGDYDGRIAWTLTVRGQTFTVPANLKTEWEIDALAGEAGSGNTPPVLRFDPHGEQGAGPTGVRGPTLRATVGRPLAVTVWARDDGAPSGSVVRTGRANVPVTLTWFKHRGPGLVTFDVPSAEVPATGGSMTTLATFGTPGEYVLRVRANDASGVAGAGHAQCCWTNGFVRVRVRP